MSSKIKKYSQHFRVQWLTDSRFKDWLLKVDGDDTKCFCKYCKCTIAAKLSDLERHKKTLKHKKAEEPFSSQRQPKLQFVKPSESVHETEAGLCLFIAEHCSLRVVDHLSALCKHHFSDSKGCKDLKLKRSKCSAVVCNILAPYFARDLKNDIGNSKFSLLIDESNDISVTKLLGIAIRYYSEGKKLVVVTFLDLVELRECNADAICHALKDSLKRNGLELQNLIALGTDNASVMIGVNSGVYARLKSEIPHLMLVKCVCHSLQLAVSHAATECLPRHLDFLIRDTYNWFSHSAVRQTRYKELYGLINEGKPPLKLIQMSQTRWMSIESAILRIVQQWTELKTHFDFARKNERCYTADLLFSMFSDMRNYVFLIFLKQILSEVQSVNKKFEADVQDPTKLLSDLVHLIDSLSAKIVIPGKKLKESDSLQEHLDPKPYLGYEFEKNMSECKFPDEIASDIRRRCIEFVIELVTQLRQRLPENFKVLQSMSSFSGSECLKPVKNDILDLAKLFVDDAEILTRIDFQWRKLHTLQWTQTSDTIGLWAEIASYRDATGENPFKELSDLALTILSLPHSNADVERVFSQMGIVKSNMRNRLAIKSLNAVLTIKYGLRRHGKSCHDYKLPESVLRKIGSVEAYQTSSQPSTSSQSDQGAETFTEEDQGEIIEWDLADLQ